MPAWQQTKGVKAQKGRRLSAVIYVTDATKTQTRTIPTSQTHRAHKDIGRHTRQLYRRETGDGNMYKSLATIVPEQNQRQINIRVHTGQILQWYSGKMPDYSMRDARNPVVGSRCWWLPKNTAIYSLGYSLHTPIAVQCLSEFNLGEWWVRMIAADRQPFGSVLCSSVNTVFHFTCHTTCLLYTSDAADE